MRKTLRTTTILLLCLFLAGCTAWPSERDMYRAACDAMANDSAIPESAEPRSIRQTRFYAGKNAAYVELPYDYVTESGRKDTGTYGCWVKRVARDWRFDRKGP